MSWEQLIALNKERRDEIARQRSETPVACPYDGTPLEYNPTRGVLFCRNSDYQIAGGPRSD